MLVDKLRVTVASQQDTEIIKRRDHTGQLHPVDQEDRQGDFLLPNRVEKKILQVL